MESQEVTRVGEQLIFTPSSAISLNVKKLQDVLISQLDGCLKVDINLRDTTEFDVAGLQLIIALKNFALVNGIEVTILKISDAVQTKLSILGVNL